jgi:hypothetical protein
MKTRISSVIAVLSMAGMACAQDGLVVGVDDTTVGMFVYKNGAWSALANSAVQVWGLAADEANETLYIAGNANTLFKWTEAGGLETIATFTYNAAAVNFVSLAYSNGKLYGTRNITTEGVYEIDPATAVATLLWAYPTAYDIGGLDVDPATGKLYGTNDATAAPLGQGLFEIDTTAQTFVKVSDYPAILGSGPNDLDGLAIGNGKAYFIPDQPGEIGVLDLATLTFDPPFANPFTTSEIFSGGAFASFLAATACYPDCDGSGGLSIDDFICFQTLFAIGDPAADCDLSGNLSIDDFICFQTSFALGC